MLRLLTAHPASAFSGDTVIHRVQSGTSRESRCACRGDGRGPMTGADADPPNTEAPDSLAEAIEELVRAEERAEAARARAAELRRTAEAGSSEQPDATESVDVAEPEPARWRPRRRWPRLRRPTRQAVGVGSAIVLLCAALAASGYIVWQHRTLVRQQQQAQELAAAAREEVAALMSIDPAHAKENLQRSIDDTTGALKSQLEATSGYMVKNAQDAQITTKATVQDVAVESMTDNSAVLLVVAKSDTTNADKSNRPTVFWRLSVDVERDGDRLKISRLDFVQ
jgi:Mce-associated membrane protein